MKEKINFVVRLILILLLICPSFPVGVIAEKLTGIQTLPVEITMSMNNQAGILNVGIYNKDEHAGQDITFQIVEMQALRIKDTVTGEVIPVWFKLPISRFFNDSNKLNVKDGNEDFIGDIFKNSLKDRNLGIKCFGETWLEPSKLNEYGNNDKLLAKYPKEFYFHIGFCEGSYVVLEKDKTYAYELSATTLISVYKLGDVLGTYRADTGEPVNYCTGLPNLYDYKFKYIDKLANIKANLDCKAEGFAKQILNVKKVIKEIDYNYKWERYKALVKKGDEKYYFELPIDNQINVPLQMGNGEYEVSIIEKIEFVSILLSEGNKYKYIYTEKISLNQSEDNVVFLQPNQLIKWDYDMKAIKKAKELTENCKSDEERVQAIYEEIINNLAYDYEKVDYLTSDYTVDIERTFDSRKGMCYDYSVLFTAMLRSIGIPTKLVMGYTDKVNGYHAWSEVLVDGTWKIVDTTYDSVARARDLEYKMWKEKTSYSANRYY